MNKRKMLLLIGIIVAAALAGFFLTKTPVNKDAKQPCATSTSTDCLILTPTGTSYYVPPKEESSATTTQSGKIDEHLTINNELREVNFCGKMYKVKQVMIDGVDVVQRVAELATKNLMPETIRVGPYGPKMDEWKTISNKNGEMAKAICGNVEFSASRAKSNELIIYGPVVQNIEKENFSYSFGIGGVLGFDIKYPSLEIETSKAEEGGSVVIGKLK